jgi:hypothetical protein
MDTQLIEALGDELFHALRERRSLQPLTARYPDLSLDTAYRISLRFLQRRQALGEQVVGKKNRRYQPCRAGNARCAPARFRFFD